MKMTNTSWFVLFLFSVAVISLVLFLIKRNRKDENELEEKLNDGYPKRKAEDGDIEIDETMH